MATPDPQPILARLRTEGPLTLEIKVIPRAQRSHVADLLADGTLKVKVNAIPENGKANAELCATLAAWLSLPTRNVEVIHGHTSQHKRVRLLPA
jgi:uncharacterized protein YggU (UPF0235/DUF167 family)